MDTHHSDFPHVSNRGLVSISVFVLLICLFYTLAAAFLASYPGFDLGPNWTVDALEPCEAKPGWCETNQDAIQIGDQLLVIGGLSYEELQHDQTRTLFSGYNPGDQVPITRRRDGEEQTVQWQMLGPTGASRTRRLVQSLLACIPFWLAGTLTLIFLQPRDLRWRLLILFNYVVAIWMAAGVCSFLTVAYASPVQHALAWLGASIFFHLHLTVPSPLLQRTQRYLMPPLYATAIILAILELFKILPGAAFNLGLLLAFLGSLGLLVFRYLARPSAWDRITTRLMLTGIGLALGPGIVMGGIPALLGTPLPTGLTINVATIAIPLLPSFYIYAIYKHHLGTLEFRVNRLLSLYSFISLYVTAFILTFSIGGRWVNSPDGLVVFSLAASTVLGIAGLSLHAHFQRRVNRLAYGSEYNPDDIIRVFANQIPAALSLEALAQLLADEVAPSLLIRQSALYLFADKEPSLAYARGVNLGETPKTPRQVRQLLTRADRYCQPRAEAQDDFDWVRLVIPLEIRKKTVGVWLFGQRDPDDYYPQSDIVLLSTLASQVAVAIENARLYEETQQRALEQGTVSRITYALNALDVREAFPALAQGLHDISGCDMVNLLLIDKVREHFIIAATEPPSPILEEGAAMPFSATAMLQNLKAGCPHLTADLSTETHFPLEQALYQANARSQVTLPLLVGGEIIGALSLTSNEPNRFRENQLPVLQQISDALASAVEHSRLFQAERKQRELAEALERAAAIVSSTLNPAEVLDRILEQVEQVVTGDTSNIILIDNGNGQAVRWRGYNRLGVAHPPTLGPLPIAHFPSLTKMAQSGASLLIPDTASDPDWVPLKGREWLRSYVAAPIRVRDLTVGFLSVNGTRPGQFNPADARRLEAFAAHAATAIENADLYQALLTHAEQLEQRVQERTAQLQAQYARLQAILHGTSDGIVVTDRQGEIIQTNPVARTWLTQILSPEDAVRLRESVQDLALRAGERPETVLELAGLDLELKAASISEPGGEEATAVVSIHDVSHLKALNRIKSRFVSNVSHELRTPVTTIKLYVALMQRTSPEEKKWGKYLSALAQEADRQVRLVEDILQISRIDTGRLEMEPRPTSLNELTEKAIASHQALAQEQGLTIEHQPAEPGPMALVDSERMMQVLGNLVGNAIRYTPEGGKVVISTGTKKAEGRIWATASVSDTGVGIPKHELPRVFERFFRGERPQAMQMSGTGLGLAIVKEIVALHGGRVTVTSTVNVGTTFTAWLPAAEGQA